MARHVFTLRALDETGSIASVETFLWRSLAEVRKIAKQRLAAYPQVEIWDSDRIETLARDPVG